MALGAPDRAGWRFVDKAEQFVGIPVTYVQATPDLVMGDLLKTMRSSQTFSVSGLPDVVVRKVAPAAAGEPERLPSSCAASTSSTRPT